MDILIKDCKFIDILALGLKFNLIGEKFDSQTGLFSYQLSDCSKVEYNLASVHILFKNTHTVLVLFDNEFYSIELFT